MWHLLSEINPKKLHAIPRVQKSQSKKETFPIFQLSSFPHLAPCFSKFHNFPLILAPEKRLETQYKGGTGYYVVTFWKPKFESKVNALWWMKNKSLNLTPCKITAYGLQQLSYPFINIDPSG